MNAKQANQVSIMSYLKSKGISPTKSYKSYSLYKSPYREDTRPSMKVSHTENLWIDYGDDNKGGTLIDLVLIMHPGKNIADAIKEIERSTNHSFSFHQQKSDILDLKENLKKEADPKIKIHKILDLGNNLAIADYLNSRGISVRIAKSYCKELYFTVGNKYFFGLGNHNEKGWSIRNKYWKGCTAQGYSYFERGFQKLSVFEGIFDLLSYLELKNHKANQEDFMVLNSLINVKRAIPILGNYKEVFLFLDHDISGRKVTANLLEHLSNAKDASSFYNSHNDLNDYYLIKIKGQFIKNNCTPRVNEASHVLVRPKRLLR
jgi:5S rRNA maturation endonuclease (ribonuclease M5)